MTKTDKNLINVGALHTILSYIKEKIAARFSGIDDSKRNKHKVNNQYADDVLINDSNIKTLTKLVLDTHGNIVTTGNNPTTFTPIPSATDPAGRNDHISQTQGLVKLQDFVNNNTTNAVTPNAVKEALDAFNAYTDASWIVERAARKIMSFESDTQAGNDHYARIAPYDTANTDYQKLLSVLTDIYEEKLVLGVNSLSTYSGSKTSGTSAPDPYGSFQNYFICDIVDNYFNYHRQGDGSDKFTYYFNFAIVDLPADPEDEFLPEAGRYVVAQIIRDALSSHLPPIPKDVGIVEYSYGAEAIFNLVEDDVTNERLTFMVGYPNSKSILPLVEFDTTNGKALFSGIIDNISYKAGVERSGSTYNKVHTEQNLTNYANTAGNATNATNVNLSKSISTNTISGDTVSIQAGSGTAASFTIVNAAHAYNANSATNATTADNYSNSGTIKSEIEKRAKVKSYPYRGTSTDVSELYLHGESSGYMNVKCDNVVVGIIPLQPPSGNDYCLKVSSTGSVSWGPYIANYPSWSAPNDVGKILTVKAHAQGDNDVYIDWDNPGYVKGPSEAVNERVPLFNGTTGKVVKNSKYYFTTEADTDSAEAASQIKTKAYNDAFRTSQQIIRASQGTGHQDGDFAYWYAQNKYRKIGLGISSYGNIKLTEFRIEGTDSKSSEYTISDNDIITSDGDQLNTKYIFKGNALTATSATNADNATKWNGYKIKVGSLPSAADEIAFL